jgi:hypothetical protein
MFNDNVIVIMYDDYVSNINLCLSNIFDFLDVDKMLVDTSRRHMVGGWIFKSKFLRYLFIPQNNLKSLLKSVLPNKKIRQALKQKMMNISTVKTPCISEEMHKKLTEYYRKDINSLSKLLNKELNHWIN